MPIDWSEVEDDDLRASRYTIEDAPAIVESRGDLWGSIRSAAGSVAQARKRLAAIA